MLKTREELNTDIQIEILAELKKSNESPVLERPVSKFQKRCDALKILIDKGANSIQLQELGESFKNRNV